MAAKHGGKRPGAGRKPGSATKVTADVREAARAYTAGALASLATTMVKSESEAARVVAAANSILDRGWGRPGIQEEPKVPAPAQPAVWPPEQPKGHAEPFRLQDWRKG